MEETAKSKKPCDFLAFFWAEVIIALALLSVVLRWLIRGPGADAK